MSRRPTEPIRVDDPDLSPEANRLLTQELREALGRDRAPAGPVRRVPRGGIGDVLGPHRSQVAISFGALLVVGIILALVTGSWWAVVAACVAHAIGTLVVVAVALQLGTQVEQMEPETAARLQEEGVADPDRALAQLVEHYADGRHGAGEVVSGGHNRVTAAAGDDPARSGIEQRTAITPAATPSKPAGSSGAPVVLPLVAVGGSLVLGIVVAAIVGGAGWIGAGLLAGSALGWLALWLRLPGERPEREGADRESSRALLPVTAVIVGAALLAGVIIVGAIAGYL
jgi:hypothetical protein